MVAALLLTGPGSEVLRAFGWMGVSYTAQAADAPQPEETPEAPADASEAEEPAAVAQHTPAAEPHEPATQPPPTAEPPAAAEPTPDGALTSEPERIAGTPEEGRAEAPAFDLTGELDAGWFARWRDGLEAGVKVRYTASVSTYDEQFRACEIQAFGLKEMRPLREGESEAALCHPVPSGNQRCAFRDGETSAEGAFLIPEAFLQTLPEGEYEVYAVYGPDHSEANFGSLQLPRPKEEPTEEPKADEHANRRAVSIAMRVEQAEGAERPIRVLMARLSGFEDAQVRLQWQYNDGVEWKDVPDASEDEYRFVVTEDNAGYQWRVKVTTEQMLTEG